MLHHPTPRASSACTTDHFGSLVPIYRVDRHRLECDDAYLPVATAVFGAQCCINSSASADRPSSLISSHSEQEDFSVCRCTASPCPYLLLWLLVMALTYALANLAISEDADKNEAELCQFAFHSCVVLDTCASTSLGATKKCHVDVRSIHSPK